VREKDFDSVFYRQQHESSSSSAINTTSDWETDCIMIAHAAETPLERCFMGIRARICLSCTRMTCRHILLATWKKRTAAHFFQLRGEAWTRITDLDSIFR
jgi:hypothetical protein